MVDSKAANLKKTFKKGEYLFKEGDASKSIFVLQKGTVEIRKVSGTKYIELDRIHANEVLGELTFFDRLPRSASAVALMDTEALELSFESLDSLFMAIPGYMRTIMASMADRLRNANDTIQKLQKGLEKNLPPEQR